VEGEQSCCLPVGKQGPVDTAGTTEWGSPHLNAYLNSSLSMVPAQPSASTDKKKTGTLTLSSSCSCTLGQLLRAQQEVPGPPQDEMPGS